MELFTSRTTILDSGKTEDKRQEILNYFKKTYTLDARLYDALARNEAFYLRPEPLRHPLIFYLGHTAVFYINKLLTAKIIDTRINPRFESMFAIGVDEMSWDDLDEKNYDWPTVDEVKDYRKLVQECVEKVIARLELKIPITWSDPFWVIMMGIEHQRIHLETSSVIIRRLPLEEVRHIPGWEICRETGEAPLNRLIAVEGGRVTLGKSRDASLYGWDNEFGTHEFDVWDYKASQLLVSNREYLSFVNENGYRQEQYWTDEGWRWVNYSRAVQPLFWKKQGDAYSLRTMTEEIEMPWDWPVEVNYLEAKAFCNWLSQKEGKAIRLPTEDEWYRLHDIHEIADQPYWKRAPGNINLEYWTSSCPVNRFKFGEFYDIIGNVWQWTETPITGFEGFEVHPCYDDFSTPTFDTQHNLIKGGSWISTGNEATRDSRYAFRRHFFQHAGFRYVQAEQSIEKPQAMYETDISVSQYCDAHYGDSYFSIGNFPETCANICLKYMADRPRERALDIGCSVGRSTFELAREFDFVNGLDFSARFIRIAFQMQEKGFIRYELPEEGEIVSYHEKRLADFQLEKTPSRIQFFQADALNLKPQFTDYDLVFSGNMLDRLNNPRIFLKSIHARLRIGGLLIIASPYTWLEEFTHQQNWLGGYRKDGEPYTTLEGLKDHLQDHFDLIDEPRDIEFVLRETARKFQHTVSQLTVWERKR